jgi:serine phosphatase RsbU (regulator of sigma subunit)
MIRFQEYHDTAKLVHHINSQLCRQSIVSNEGGFITLLYGVLNPDTREFRWASAGHNMPLVHNLATDEIYEIAEPGEGSGLPIGIFEEAEYETMSAIIPENSRLMLYTDGLVEAFPADQNGQHLEFGMEGVKQTMRKHRHDSVDQCLDGLFRDSYQFTCGAGRHDDTSILLVESE